MESYRELLPTLGPVNENRFSRILSALPFGARIVARLNRATAVASVARHGPFDAVYSSTLTNGDLLRTAVPPDVPVVSRASELQHWLQNRVEPAHLTFTLQRSSTIIAVSEAVRQNLVENHGVSSQNVVVIPGFVEAVPSPESRAAMRRDSRRLLGVGDDTIVVGCAGTTDWRKGPDLFLQTARLCASDPRLQFVWIGGRQDVSTLQLEHDARACGLENLRFISERPDVAVLMAGFDLLCLTSREDPYPVVMLEAGAVGVPIICFAGGGGAPEFAQRGAGRIVPYLDTNALASEIMGLADDEHRRRTMGENACDLVRSEHTVDTVAPRIHELLIAASQSTANHDVGLRRE